MKCSVLDCGDKSRGHGLCSRHYTRWRTHGDPLIERPQGGSVKRGGFTNKLGYRVITAPEGGQVYEHIHIAETALGNKLPPKAEVHHVDEIKSNNARTNLVVCPDRAYHMLLHQRQRALDACGNASWRKCNVCREYDDPRNMYVHAKTSYHNQCKNEQNRRALCQITS